VAKWTGSRAVIRAKAAAARGQKTAAYRAYKRYQARRGSRLAAAVTYSAFLSLFPLLALAVAITAGTLGESGIAKLRTQIQQNLPGLSDKLPLDPVTGNAPAIGLISALLFAWSGLSWVDMMRASLRTIWAVDDEPGGFVTRKLADLASLAGLGVVAGISLSASAVTSALTGTAVRWLHITDTTGARAFLWLLATAVGLMASTLLFAFLLAVIPRLAMPRGVLLRTALAGAVLFEVTKDLLGVYLDHVASKTLYGAFGVPVAVLLWLNITFQVVLYLSAWTATRTQDLRNRSTGP
jgi:membrane protein